MAGWDQSVACWMSGNWSQAVEAQRVGASMNARDESKSAGEEKKRDVSERSAFSQTVPKQPHPPGEKWTSDTQQLWVVSFFSPPLIFHLFHLNVVKGSASVPLNGSNRAFYLTNCRHVVSENEENGGKVGVCVRVGERAAEEENMSYKLKNLFLSPWQQHIPLLISALLSVITLGATDYILTLFISQWHLRKFEKIALL